ncbi:translocase of chloroplast 159, chloroplastic isoform X2 [Trifolium pratense]|uniref:translocase of chloroplast 159, chloroplastic isoform X2 n=1 Tax=Trifolium pratense TaxID=57577 RepID=UPI001E694E33|nr:translocase of chloroplast 159, chloroplastic isoform X2 [Trifolium pratense]
MDSQTLSSSSSQFPEQPNNTLLNGVNGHGSDSDDGFLSGEDETEPSRPILVHPDAIKSTGVVEQPPLDAESPRPIAKITDDDEDVAEDEEDEEEDLQKGGDDDEVKEEEVFVEANDGEVFVEADDKGFEGDGVVELENEINKFLQEEAEAAAGINHSDSVVVESVSGDNLGDGGGDGGDEDEKFTSGGDFVVDSLQVNPLVDGSVAVVGDEVEVEVSEIEKVVAPVPDLSVDNSFEPIEEVGGEGVVDEIGSSSEPVEKGGEVVGGDVEPGEVVDSGVGVDDVVAHEQVSDIAPIEKVVDEVVSGSAEAGEVVDSGVDVAHNEISDIAPLEKAGDVIDEVVFRDAESDEVVDIGVDEGVAHEQVSEIAPTEKGEESSEVVSQSLEAKEDKTNIEGGAEGEIESRVDGAVEEEVGSNVAQVEDGSNVDNVEVEDGSHVDNAVLEEAESSVDRVIEVDDGRHVEAAVDHHVDREIDDLVSDTREESMLFGGSDSANKYLEELQRHMRASESSQDDRIDGQIVTDSDEEADSDDEGDGKELFDTAALAALLKAATGAGGEDGGGITITAQDGSRLFSVERPAGLGPSLQTGKPAVRSNRPNLFAPSISRAGTVVSDTNLSEEDKMKLEKLQEIRIKFLRMVQRLGFTTEESIAAQVLYRLTLVAGRQTGEFFSLDAAKESASRLEAEGRDDFEFSLNILVLGKTGVGKSATINSIFGETKTSFSAYGPATTAVTEVVGMVDGVKIRVFDTPGLKSSAFEQSYNRKVLSNVKKLTKKSPPDIVLYVDRLDLQTRDMNDLPMLRSVTSALGPSIWRNVIVTLTHAASAPPDGPSGSPLSYDVFVAQRSHIVQQTIGQAVGDLRLMNPSLMNPVSLVENHPSCRKNRDGQKVLPNGQSWRPLLLLLCYSMKILSEAGNVSKTQETADSRRLFGFRTRSPPLPYLLSWLLQSRAHPKLPDQGGIDNGDSDIEMADLSDSDGEEGENEYDQLPPFKPLRKSQFAKLNKEQRKAYLEEYDYRVKLLQKKQWSEELKRMREMKKRGGKAAENDNGYTEEYDDENGSPAAVPVPLPDMVLPPSFDSDNPAYRYRFLEPTSQLLTRPVLDTHSWDHDCGYDGVNIENSMAIINKFPAAVTVQVTKDKQDFSIHLDSSVAAKHGENGSTMAGFDIQNIGKQLAYIVRGESKFKIFKRNKTAAGVSVTFLGENVSTGVKLEDQIALGKRLVLVGSTGTVRSQGDAAYGANLEVRLREADFPVGQDQSSLSLSLVQWRGDLALGANFQSQFSLGRNYKMAVRAGLNNKLSGQITVRTSSAEQLQIALIAILPIAKTLYKNFWPGASEKYSIY